MLPITTDAPCAAQLHVELSFSLAQGAQLICGGQHGVIRTREGGCTQGALRPCMHRQREAHCGRHQQLCFSGGVMHAQCHAASSCTAATLWAFSRALQERPIFAGSQHALEQWRRHWNACVPLEGSTAEDGPLLQGSPGKDIPLLQGSNAHVVMEVNSNDSPPSVMAMPGQIWQRSRYWLWPAAHALLTYCRCFGSGKGSAHFACLLHHPALAYVRECCLHETQNMPSAVPIEVRTSVSQTLETL